MIDDVRELEAQVRDSAGYRRLSVMLGIALVVLIGTTIYLVVRDRLDTWATARSNTRDISIASQVSISGLLAQSAASLDAIGADMRKGSTPTARTPLLLSEAMRFDPLSSYLGLRRATDGSVTAVDASGKPVSLNVAAAMQSLIAPPGSAKLSVAQLIQLPAIRHGICR